MRDEALRQHLDEAISRINELPESRRAPLLALVEETRRRHQQLRRDFSRIAEAVDDWRLAMKYLLFDRDASQRENAALRRRLNERESGLGDAGG